MPADRAEGLVGYAEAARFLGLAEGTLRNWRPRFDELELPYYRLGNGAGPVRFLLSELGAWRAARAHHRPVVGSAHPRRKGGETE